MLHFGVYITLEHSSFMPVRMPSLELPDKNSLNVSFIICFWNKIFSYYKCWSYCRSLQHLVHFLAVCTVSFSPYHVNSAVLTMICSQGIGWWPLSAGFWKCQQQFLPSKTQFEFNLKENIVAQCAGYPTSIESRSDVIRKCVKIVRLWTVIVFWPCSEKAVKLFYFRSIFYHFESTLEPN